VKVKLATQGLSGIASSYVSEKETEWNGNKQADHFRIKKFNPCV